jgi:hypothetical protein
MIIDPKDGYQTITLDNGRAFDIGTLELPDYGVDGEGNSYIFTKQDREAIAAYMVGKCQEYAAKEVKNV